MGQLYKAGTYKADNLYKAHTRISTKSFYVHHSQMMVMANKAKLETK